MTRSAHSEDQKDYPSITSAIKEVTKISADRTRTIYERMTSNRAALELLSIGLVHCVSSVIRTPCEDPNPF